MTTQHAATMTRACSACGTTDARAWEYCSHCGRAATYRRPRLTPRKEEWSDFVVTAVITTAILTVVIMCVGGA